MLSSFQEIVFKHYNIISDSKSEVSSNDTEYAEVEEGMLYRLTENGRMPVLNVLVFFELLQRSIFDPPSSDFPNIFDSAKDNDASNMAIRKAYINATRTPNAIPDFCEILAQSVEYKCYIALALFRINM